MARLYQRPANKITVNSCKGKVSPTVGRGWADPGGEGRTIISFPPPWRLQHYFSLCTHTFHGAGVGGNEKEKRRWRVFLLLPRHSSWAGGRVSSSSREPWGAGLLARPSVQRCARGAGRGILDIVLVGAESIIEKMRVHYRFWPWNACLGRRLGGVLKSLLSGLNLNKHPPFPFITRMKWLAL